MTTNRTPLEAIESVITLVPDTEADLLAELERCRTSASYAAPEIYRQVFMRATGAISEALGPPPLEGWKERVRAAWMGEPEGDPS